jgi:hypothetical protein
LREPQVDVFKEFRRLLSRIGQVRRA